MGLKSVNLDLKDRKILYELDKDARLSCAQIGRRVGLSTEVVYYRIKKLETEGIISGYQTVVNYSKLGLIHFKICFKYVGICLDVEEELYSKLSLIDSVVWIAKTQGEWDSIISCSVNNISELDNVKDKIISLASDYISEKSISISSQTWSFPRNYFVGLESEKKMFDSEVVVDNFDLKLLRILSKDARKSVVSLSKILGISSRVISLRIKKLVRSGVIDCFRLIVDYEKLGIHFFKTFIYLKNPSDSRLKKLLSKINFNFNVINNLKVIGEWDLEPEFEFEDKNEFQRTIQNLMNEFSDIIQRVSVINIVKEYKYTFFHK